MQAPALAGSLAWAPKATLAALAMSVLSVTTNTKVAPVPDVAPRCKGQISDWCKMSLDEIRKKVIFHNSVDVWIATCFEKNADWTNPQDYKKFIAHLLENKLNLKAFNLCAHEAGATEDEKVKFTETLAETKDSDPNSLTYTIKLNDSALDVIRKYSV